MGEMVHQRRRQDTTSTMKEFTPLANKKVQRERKTLMDMTENLMTLARTAGVSLKMMLNTSLTIPNRRLRVDMASHQRALTPLIWADTSLSVPRDRVTLQLVSKITTTPLAVKELFSSVSELSMIPLMPLLPPLPAPVQSTQLSRPPLAT